MKKNQIQLSTEFKKQTSIAILSIVFFLITYLFIVLLACCLTALCIIGGYLLITAKPMFLTIVFGIGIASLGVLILVFLLKFLFKRHKVDRSHLIEIKRNEEPELFRMLDEITKEVGTSFPKRVFLSTEVNASVFYDSGFWSMFIPVRKNLKIGMGLVNTVTREEMKGILAHEFGHFSQSTMAVGSYVYNVNQVIFNMLYDNESYEKLVQGWSEINGAFSLFSVLALNINEGIRQVLRKLYGVVNKSYMGLSREMEFHADAIAASVTGKEPLQRSLLRMALADHSFNETVNYFNRRIASNQRTGNIYVHQFFVMQFIAERNKMNFRNGFPEISQEEQSKFDKSKLVIKNQWASHPSVEDRIERLDGTGFSSTSESEVPANMLFKDIRMRQEQLTNHMFQHVAYKETPTNISNDSFEQEYRTEVENNSFASIYNGYYDNNNPRHIDLVSNDEISTSGGPEVLFSDEKVDLVYTAMALQNDLETLKNIASGRLPIKTFDYDGKRYKQKHASALVSELTEELKRTNHLITNNDQNIYNYFRNAERVQQKEPELHKLYKRFFDYDNLFEQRYDLYVQLMERLYFVSVNTPIEDIRNNFRKLKPIEVKLKDEMDRMLRDWTYMEDFTEEMQSDLQKYVSKELVYFDGTRYLNENLEILYSAMNHYSFLLSRKYFILKKAILDHQEKLVRQ